MNILITGGAGYIGSHTVHAFLDAGHDVVVIDNLSTGNKRLLPSNIIFYEENAGNTKIVSDIIKKHEITSVIHFAGSIVVSESVSNPSKYYQNNTFVSLQLLRACAENNVKNFIFSSTASVYGSNPKQIMKEDYPPNPENPYASSKLMTEMMLKDISKAHGINYAVLRYFNVAGADTKGRTGQVCDNATHLIKVACETAAGLRPEINVYGTDYDTTDGTCIRDYIHVTDLADIHLRIFEMMQNKKVNDVYNCGYGKGYSVLEIIDAVENISELKIKKILSERRAGDPVALIADSQKLKDDTGWKAKHDDINLIIKSALDWERKNYKEK